MPYPPSTINIAASTAPATSIGGPPAQNFLAPGTSSQTAVDRQESALSGEWAPVSPAEEEYDEDEEEPVVGPVLVPITPIMRFAMREVSVQLDGQVIEANVRVYRSYRSMKMCRRFRSMLLSLMWTLRNIDFLFCGWTICIRILMILLFSSCLSFRGTNYAMNLA
jgi:hypothetical protein